MKIVYEFIRDGIEGDVRVEENKDTGVTRVIVEPYFYSATAHMPVVRVSSEADAAEKSNELQVVSGKTGRLKRVTAKRVKPQCDGAEKAAE